MEFEKIRERFYKSHPYFKHLSDKELARNIVIAAHIEGLYLSDEDQKILEEKSKEKLDD